MGKRGPAPKPTALKKLEGNPGKQKIKDTGEPKPTPLSTVPKPPAHLTSEAKKEWRRLAPSLVALGLLTDIDLSAFGSLCQNYAYYIIADKEILKLGEQGTFAMQKTPSGYIQQHPLLSLRRQYYDTWHKGLADFGLTPASRARLFIGDGMPNGMGAPQHDDDPIERILNGEY